MDERLKQLLAKGREHYEKKEFDLAEPYLREVVEELPEFADVQNMLGVTYYHQERYELSQKAFEQALKINPRYTEAALNLAVTYNELGRYDESMELQAGAFAAATCCGDDGVDPFALGKIANMHAQTANAYEDLRLFDKAAREYTKALELCPDFADLRTRLGHVLREMGEFAKAEEQYAQAKKSKPSYVPARVYLGISMFAQGKKDQALAEWEEAIGLDPDNRLAKSSLAMVKKLEKDDGKQEPEPETDEPGSK